ncbi:MAG: amidohydrolase [Acidimicrobiales bacterium]|jgi:predicted amidohydrolase YtcJ|nr:amidohydrolase [Actinomycetota bacterium]MEC9089100.1 amidohydrolase [Actinomycetota bacterium]|tara:strand:- start:583 stop:2244 length:1662 start_codon:yes stop_codon:yes gene_type:complete
MEDITVYSAAQVHTMDPGRPQASAVAVSGGKIVSVGSIESMQPWLRRYPYSIDDRYREKILMPGFIDPHTHLRLSGTYMGLNYLGPIDSAAPSGIRKGLPNRDAVLNQLRALVAEHNDPNIPITAWGYDPASQAGHLDRDMLDQISDSVPIWVIAYAPHIVYANTPMIEMIGVDDDSVGHGIGRYPDGRLNGWFVETEATALAARPVAKQVYGPNAGRAAIDRMGAVAKGAGVTTTADLVWGMADGFEPEWNDHASAIAEGTFPLRIFMIPFEPKLVREFGSEMLQFLESKRAEGNERLNTHGVKYVNDGSYPSMTLVMNEPGYLDEDGAHTGEIPWEDMVDRMLPFWKAGIQIHSHANGDRTLDMTLDTLESLQRIHPRFDHRFTVEHYCISSPAQARRLAALGGQASVNIYFVHFRAQLHSEHGFGPDRSEATARLGSLQRAGAPFALHSDFNLVVTPLSPLLATWCAVNRLGADGETVMAPGERISVDSALRAITIDAAYILNRDHCLGSLEVGKHADFTILNDDPYEVAPSKIKDIEVHDTVLEGEPTN